MNAQTAARPVCGGDAYVHNRIYAHRTGGPGFADVLRSRTAELKFSAHAKSRLLSRNIAMTPELIHKLDQAVAGAEKKGARDSLVLLSDLAFIVNIPNRTVVTAMDGASVKENVFTNIDSAVVAG